MAMLATAPHVIGDFSFGIAQDCGRLDFAGCSRESRLEDWPVCDDQILD
jgi:hypothetical protein